MRSLTRPTAVLALVFVAVLGLAACGGDDNKSSSSGTTTPSTTASSTGSTVPSSSTSAAAGEQTVAIQNFKFNPTPLLTKTGKVTVVILDDAVPHSLTADDKSFDTGVFKKENGPKTITLSKTGTFSYHCEVHDFMKGSFVVS